MEEYVRAHVCLSTVAEATDFVAALNADGTANKYILEDFSGTRRVDARSLLGVIYAITEFNDNTFLVNENENGKFPYSIDKYRA